MKPLPLALMLLLLAAPVAGQTLPAPGDPSADPPAAAEGEGDLDQGLSLLGEGARLLFRGLMAEMEPALTEMGEALTQMEPVLRDLARMIGDIRNYHAPEMLPNGDILIRRKVPLSLPPGGEELDL